MAKEQRHRESEIIIVTTTTDSRDEAVKIGRTMVEKRLAACAQIGGPIESHFWWNGKLDTAEEWLCRMKTGKCLYPELEKAVKEMHSYDVPQIVSIKASDALPEFESWVRDETDENR